MPRRRHHDPEVLALMAAHGQVVKSEDDLMRTVGVLYVAGLLRERLSALSDQAIGNLMFDFVWDELSMHCPTGVIVQVATARLRSENSEAATSFRDTLKF